MGDRAVLWNIVGSVPAGDNPRQEHQVLLFESHFL